MTPLQAIDKVYNGGTIKCTSSEYPDIRNALQEKSCKLIDSGDSLRAMMMLNEVKRLDKLFNDSSWCWYCGRPSGETMCRIHPAKCKDV